MAPPLKSEDIKILKIGRIGTGRLGTILFKNRHSGSWINEKNYSITELEAEFVFKNTIPPLSELETGYMQGIICKCMLF